LLECRNIQGKDEMTKYDRLAAHGAALLGSRSSYGRAEAFQDTQDFDIGDVGFLCPRGF